MSVSGYDQYGGTTALDQTHDEVETRSWKGATPAELLLLEGDIDDCTTVRDLMKI